MRHRIPLLPVLLAAALLAAVPGCGGPSVPRGAPPAPSSVPATGDFSGQVEVGGGRKVYLGCKGSGSPTVILESGLHDSSDTWTITDTRPPVPKAPAVFPGVAAFTRVRRYDRPGTVRYVDPPTLTTRSTPVDGTRALTAMADDLDTLLTSARLPGPYVLVGHSFGGMITRLYAQRHPVRRRGWSSSTPSVRTSEPSSAPAGPRTARCSTGPARPSTRDPTSRGWTSTARSTPSAPRRPCPRSPWPYSARRNRSPLRPEPRRTSWTPWSGLAPGPAEAGRAGDPDPAVPGHRERPLRPGARSRPDDQRGPARRGPRPRRAVGVVRDVGEVRAGRWGRPGPHDQARSNRSRFITLSHAATKSFTNFSFASSLA